MTDWTDHAACKGVDDVGREVSVFHPDVATNSDGGRNAKRAYERARTYCRRCPVTLECLEDALGRETASTRHGVWGGLSPRQRGNLKPDGDLRDAIARALEPVLMAEDAPDGTWTMDEMRAGIAAYDRRRRGGPALTDDQTAACRAYHRLRAARARDNKRKAQQT